MNPFKKLRIGLYMATVIIDGYEYDVTSFLPRHPGGEEIIRSFQGCDATDVFKEFHPPYARKYLCTLPRNEVNTITSRFEKDMRTLCKQLEDDGLFDADPIFYTGKVIELLSILFVTLYLLNTHWHLSAFMMGLFFQQAGWLAHDFAHTQVTHKYKPIFVTLLGTVAQGFTGEWWIPKHMMHHARPNAVDEKNGKPWDTDIDTAPFIYWTNLLLNSKTNPSFMLKYQGYILWLILPFSKFVWDFNSLVATYKRRAWGQVGLSIAHHGVIILLLGLPYYIVSRLWGGFLIGWVFIMSHNGTEYYLRPDVPFYESQIRTTRNVSPDWFMTWFTGGLNYQIEHHMFPKLPRHSLPKVATKVRGICERHGFDYIVMGMVECSMHLTSYLNNLWKSKK